MRIFLLILSLLGLFACTKHKGLPPVEEPCPEFGAISYSKDIQPFFSEHCSRPGCHRGGESKGDLNLLPEYSYQQITREGKGYIDTLRPEYSIIYAQIFSATNPMPPEGGLHKCEPEMLLEWIRQGAKNN